MTCNNAGVACSGPVDSFLRNSYMPCSEVIRRNLKGQSFKHASGKGRKHRGLKSNTQEPTRERANANFRGSCLRPEPHE